MHWEQSVPAEEIQAGLTEDIHKNISRRHFLHLPDAPVIAQQPREVSRLSWQKRLLAGTAAGLMLVSMNEGALGSSEPSDCDATDIACELIQADLAIPESMPVGPLTVDLLTTTTMTLPPEMTIPPETTSTTVFIPPETVPETIPPVVAASTNPERIGVAPETITAIESMSLTREGYQNFFNRIDQSWYDYAQQFLEFNPDAVSNPGNYAPGREGDAISQNATQWVTAHYTVGYYNEVPGNNHEPIGDVSYVGRAIDFQATERGIPCCGFNFLIDRNGGIYQLAPFWAKLRHNPPFDGVTTGFEIEAYLQEQITPAQYETATYLTIAMLQNEGLLGTASLYDLLHGHGDDRDSYRENHPEDTRWDQRNDFDRALMEIWIPRIEAFLAANPDLPTLTQPLR